MISSYLKFFEEKGHKIIPSVSLVPENDPTVLFTTAGMHPLVPYLLGEPHPLGKRLASIQKCMRTDDIDEVGDSYHHTFFLMLGNWSLGDYFKKRAIEWSFEFLTKVLFMPVDKLSVTVFGGDKEVARDEESARIWESLGIARERIYYLGREDNWWGPAGKVGPCGPDTEVFYDTGKRSCREDCQPGCLCGKYIEIWNNVFMEFNRKIKKVKKEGEVEEDYYFEPLKQKNVDTGMGVERTIAVLNGVSDDYQTELFWPVIKKLEEICKKKYREEKRAFRIIADHLRAAVFIIADKVEPSNKERGYVLRRLIRRLVLYGRRRLGIKSQFSSKIAEETIKIYGTLFREVLENKERVRRILREEEEKFLLIIKTADKEIRKQEKLNGESAFYLYETYGIPLELTMEIAKERGEEVKREEFEEEFKKHQEVSRKAARGRFKGGLADDKKEMVKLHTATHLLGWGLREILSKDIRQKGSNITSERLRFDFNFSRRLKEEEIEKIEDFVNKKISDNLEVRMKMMSFEKAKKEGAIAVFGDNYPERVKVYYIGESTEICGGPHVDFTEELGRFKILKQESVGKGVRRIYAELKE